MDFVRTDAVTMLSGGLNKHKQEGYTSVLDADIKAFYDTIPHKLIMNALREKIADGF